MKFRIKEITYQDSYGIEFEKFIKKWKKYKNDNNYYVQFTTRDLGYDNRSGFDNPNHSDPKGVYGYPLKYVIDYPSDIWYGANANYLRILYNLHPEKTLQLQNIDFVQANNLINKTREKGSDVSNGIFNKLEKEFKDVSRWGKIFFQTIQRKYTDNNNYIIRSAVEQNKILLNTGFWAIEDTPTRASQSVINSREPLQICFLTPMCFKVIENFKLKIHKDKPSLVVNTPTEEFERFIVQKIFNEVFNDKIAKNIKPKEYIDYRIEFYNEYISKGGRYIKIESKDASLNYRMNNLKLGEKPHKSNKKSNFFYFKIELKCEKGEFVFISNTDESMNDTISYIKEKVKEAEFDPNWEKFTKERHIANLYNKRDKEEEEALKKQKEETLKEFEDCFASWKDLSKLINIPIPNYNTKSNDIKISFVNSAKFLRAIITKTVEHEFNGKVILLEPAFKEIENDEDILGKVRHGIPFKKFYFEVFKPLLIASQNYYTAYTQIHRDGGVYSLVREIEEKNENKN